MLWIKMNPDRGIGTTMFLLLSLGSQGKSYHESDIQGLKE